jgi:acyl-homoserine-lactone acylase
LKLVPAEPTEYYVDGKVNQMGARTVQVQVLHGAVRHTFYTTRWGTVLDVPQAGLTWTKATAFAIDDSEFSDAVRFANQYLRMGQATSVNDLLEVESTYLATPFFNTIASDDTGHALHADVGNVPGVPASLIRACTPGGRRVAIVRGRRARHPGRFAPGVRVAHLPRDTGARHLGRQSGAAHGADGLRRELQRSYWLANPRAPFPAYSPIIGDTDVAQGLRTRI